VTHIDTGVISLMLSDTAAVAVVNREMRLCHKLPSDGFWYRSHFGSHPRMVVMTQHSSVSLLDMRVCLNCSIRDFMQY